MSWWTRNGVAALTGGSAKMHLAEGRRRSSRLKRVGKKEGTRSPNVVFVEGMVLPGQQDLFYYGGADKFVGVAEATRAVVDCAPRGYLA